MFGHRRCLKGAMLNWGDKDAAELLAVQLQESWQNKGRGRRCVKLLRIASPIGLNSPVQCARMGQSGFGLDRNLCIEGLLDFESLSLSLVLCTFWHSSCEEVTF